MANEVYGPGDCRLKQSVKIRYVVPEVVEAASANVLREAMTAMVRCEDVARKSTRDSVPGGSLLKEAVQDDRGARALSPLTNTQAQAGRARLDIAFTHGDQGSKR